MVEYNLKITTNKRNKTITIRKFYNGKLIAKYRSYRLSSDEFSYFENGFATQNDIKNFLKSSDYYIIG